MKFTITKYRKEDDAYDCKDESGKWHRIDFHVCGSQPIKAFLEREKLIGKIVTVDYVQPFLELAGNVLSVDNAPEREGDGR